MRTGIRLVLAMAILTAMAGIPSAEAVHFYRGPGGGCTPTDGATGDGAGVTPAATVLMLHNTFNDSSTGLPITRVSVGDAVKWTWNSVHCHSVQAPEFYSGFHYPTTEPTTPRGIPGFFDYPVLEMNPTLSWTHVFNTAGTYLYACEHHALIGMRGLVIVDA